MIEIVVIIADSGKVVVDVDKTAVLKRKRGEYRKC